MKHANNSDGRNDAPDDVAKLLARKGKNVSRVELIDWRANPKEPGRQIVALAPC